MPIPPMVLLPDSRPGTWPACSSDLNTGPEHGMGSLSIALTWQPPPEHHLGLGSEGCYRESLFPPSWSRRYPLGLLGLAS